MKNSEIFLLNTILAIASKEQQENRHLRYGQCIFNATWKEFPDIANQIRGTPMDCFYDDNKVWEFLSIVEKLWYEYNKKE